MKGNAIYLTRSDIGAYSKHANAYLKPLEVATGCKTTLFVPEFCHLPREIEEKCAGVIRFNGLMGLVLLKPEIDKATQIFTGFDFPCMFKAWWLKRQRGCKWTMFLWDPPSLSHRDQFTLLRWAIDAVFRFLAKRCDKLILNIHPGLLDQIGYKPHEGQMEMRMQDAFDDMIFPPVDDSAESEYDIGVLSNWSKAKGGKLMVSALGKLPGKTCIWIGDAPNRRIASQITFTGRLPQKEAFEKLRRCRVLVVPYMPTNALKWNYPLKLFEYLRLGKPILASDNPGVEAIAARVKDRVKLFRSGDVDDFVDKLRLCV